MTMTGDKKSRCPDHPKLVAAFVGDLGSRRTERILAHAGNCPRCRVKLEMLFQLRPELEARRDLVPEKLTRDERKAWRLIAADRAGAPRPGLRPAPSASRRLKPVWIAAAVLAVIAAGYLGFSRFGRTDIVRDDSSSNLKLLEPLGRLSEAPGHLVWETPPGADRCRVSIASEKLDTIFNGVATVQGRLDLPEEIRKSLMPGVVYLWTVEVTDDLERVVGRGRGFFEIR
jgi:hypothetical protein